MFIDNIIFNNEKGDYTVNNIFFSYLSLTFKRNSYFYLFVYNNNVILDNFFK